MIIPAARRRAMRAPTASLASPLDGDARDGAQKLRMPLSDGLLANPQARDSVGSVVGGGSGTLRRSARLTCPQPAKATRAEHSSAPLALITRRAFRRRASTNVSQRSASDKPPLSRRRSRPRWPLPVEAVTLTPAADPPAGALARVRSAPASSEPPPRKSLAPDASLPQKPVWVPLLCS